MYTWPDDDESIPGPLLVAAWNRLEMRPAPALPRWAAHWLAAGWDGPALADLAGRAPGDGSAAELLPAALLDCGIPPLDLTAAADIGSTAVAMLLVSGRRDERDTLDAVSHLLSHATDGSGSPVDVPLQRMRDLDGEWRRGRPADEIRRLVRVMCVEQVGRSAWPRLIIGRPDAVTGNDVPLMPELEFWPEYGSGPLWRGGRAIDLQTVGVEADLVRRLLAWNAEYADEKLPAGGPGDIEWIDRGRALLAGIRAAVEGEVVVVVTEPWWDGPVS